MFACQPPAARSVPASWKCSETSTASGLSRAHRRADGARHLERQVVVGVPAGHVGDVDAPAVQGVRLDQPAADHGVRALDHAAGQRRGVVVELRQRRVLEPADVARVVVVQ